MDYVRSQTRRDGPIVGATKLRHIDDALAAVTLTLSQTEIARLEEPYIPHRILGHG